MQDVHLLVLVVTSGVKVLVGQPKLLAATCMEVTTASTSSFVLLVGLVDKEVSQLCYQAGFRYGGVKCDIVVCCVYQVMLQVPTVHQELVASQILVVHRVPVLVAVVIR